VAALGQLARREQFDVGRAAQAVHDLGINPEKVDPFEA
jgi:hypothetical protein